MISKEGLLDPEEAIQQATASGHGIGKSALVSMIILWAFTTFPDCRGVVTANTETQLKTKTWSELGRWFNLCWFAKDHFILNATSLESRDPSRTRTWRIDMIPWSEKNTEAFAGLHNKGKRLLLIMDEASAIPDVIWETAEGALTDSNTQILWLVFGNPTRNSGRFKECFAGGKHAEFWHSRQIDSRTVSITNKGRFEKWIKAYGADSDFVRVRVLGQFPRIGEMEFFSAADIDAAMSPDREVFVDAHTLWLLVLTLLVLAVTTQLYFLVKDATQEACLVRSLTGSQRSNSPIVSTQPSIGSAPMVSSSTKAE